MRNDEKRSVFNPHSAIFCSARNPDGSYVSNLIYSQLNEGERTMSKAPPATALRYGVALVSVTLALIVRLLLHPVLDTDAPLLLFALSVMVSAWYGGYGPGVFATLLGAATGSFLFLEPLYSLSIASTSDRVAVALFVVTGLLISILNQALLSSRRRAEEQEKERARLLVSEREARETAEAANRTKDEFLATISHELRTPLASMLMWIRMLDSGQLDEETATHARKTLVGNIKSLSQLINDLLDVSRIVSGKLRLETRPVELAPVIEAALGVVRPAADAKSIKMKTTLDQTARHVAGDPDRLQQVLWNLLSNAVKFTPMGGSVEVALEYTDSAARIAITDTGIGIAEENLPHVFERFYQAGNRSEGRGLGLGLAIVRHLVEMQGGAAHAKSAGVGRGATFTVTMPLQRDEGGGMRAE
ncbi:MAG: sensor histidine kinase [Pyrinomonadaceae bacterium]